MIQGLRTTINPPPLLAAAARYTPVAKRSPSFDEPFDVGVHRDGIGR